VNYPAYWFVTFNSIYVECIHLRMWYQQPKPFEKMTYKGTIQFELFIESTLAVSMNE